MEKINCIFCGGSEEDRILIQENGFLGRRCDRCGLIYISPRPSLNEIRNHYSHDKAYLSADSHEARSFSKGLQARHHLSILRRYCRKGRLLELGSGAGQFLFEARRSGYEVYGIEWNRKQLNYIRDRLNIRCEEGNLTQAYKKINFDIIYHCDVASHLYDPIFEFCSMNERLSQDGILMFETGSANFSEKYLPSFPSFQYPDHLFFFSDKNIVELLTKAGFKILKIYKWSILPELYLKKSLLKRRVKASSGKRDSGQIQPIDYLHKKGGFIGKGLDVFLFLLRYGIGYVLPKKNIPCTCMIIAQKKGHPIH